MINFRLKFFTFILVIVIFIFSIFLCEFVLRYIGLGDPIIYEKNASWRYSLLEDQERQRFNNNIVKINKAGLRSNKEWIKKDNKLILFIGDSVTYGGSKIDNSELFSEKVCELIKKDFVCGNAGVNGYGILNMVLRTKFDERIKNADVVVFVVILEDFWRGLVDIKHMHYFTSSPNRIFPALEEALNFISWKYDINNYLGHRDKTPEKENLEKKMHINATNFAINIFNQEIERLKSINKNVFVFFSPTKSSLIKSEKEWVEEIKKIVLENTKNIFNMSSEFKKTNLDLYYDNVHYNVLGHEIAAKVIFKEIRDKLN